MDCAKHKAQVGKNKTQDRGRLKEIMKNCFKNRLKWDLVMHNYLKLEH